LLQPFLSRITITSWRSCNADAGTIAVTGPSIALTIALDLLALLLLEWVKIA